MNPDLARKLAASGEKVYPAAIYDLGKRHAVRVPIIVVVEESQDITLAKWPEVQVFAQGQSPAEAINALKQEIITLFDDLVGSPAETLGSQPTKWLRTVIAVIKTRA